MKDGGSKPPRRMRRQFTAEFKAGAVRLVLDEGKTIAQVARDLDVVASVLATWVKHARADRTKGKTGLTTEERAELAKLKKENRELRMERDILKKAAALKYPRDSKFVRQEFRSLGIAADWWVDAGAGI